MMNFEISRAAITDFPLMKHLFYQTVSNFGSKLFTKEEIKEYSRLVTDTKYWKQKFDHNFIFAAKLNGEILGIISMGPTGIIEILFVHQNYQGRSIAKKLYQTIEDTARTHNISVLRSHVFPLTRAFYENNGFEIIADVKETASGESITSYSGVKQLSK